MEENFTRVSVRDFVPEELAQDAREAISKLPEEDWNVSIHPYLPNMYCFFNVASNLDTIEAGKASANAAYNRNEFSYVFYRCDPHRDPECACGICRTMRHLQSPPVLERIGEITGEVLSGTVSVFASGYRPGCFLHTHTDTGRGKIAFVLNLTREWDPKHGGHLELMEWNELVAPTFNTLTLFKVTGQGTPHRVTRVADDAPSNRIAISGWFV